MARTLDAAFRRDVITRPGVADLISFRVWRSVVVRTGDQSPCDWHYWREQGWLERSCFVDVPVNPLANAPAELIERLIARAIRNVSVGPVI